MDDASHRFEPTLIRRELERPRRRSRGSLDTWLSKRADVDIRGTKDRGSLISPREEVWNCPVYPVRLIVRRGKVYIEPHTPEQLALAAIAGSAPCNCESRKQTLVNWQRGTLRTETRSAAPSIREQACSLGSDTGPYVDPDWLYLPDLSRKERKERWAKAVRSRMPALVRLMLRDAYSVTETWHRSVWRPGFAEMLCDPSRGEGVVEVHPLYDHKSRPGYAYVRLLLIGKRSPDHTKGCAAIRLVGIPRTRLVGDWKYGPELFEEIALDPLAIGHAVMSLTPRAQIEQALEENRDKPVEYVW